MVKENLFLLWKNFLVEQDVLYGLLETIKFKILMRIVLHVFHTPCLPVCTLKVHVTVTEKNKNGRKTGIIL